MGVYLRTDRRTLVWIAVTASIILIFSFMRQQMTVPSRSFLHSRPTSTWLGKKNRVKTLGQPCDNVKESIAVCITGEKRAFNKKIWNSILRNVRLNTTNPACVHHFLVLDQPLDADTRPPKQTEYWNYAIMDLHVPKDSKLLQIHEIENDFQYKPEDTVFSTSELYIDAYDKSGHVNVSDLDALDTFFRDRGAGQTNKWLRCVSLVVAKEREQGWNYSYIVRTRPDALWYAPLQSYITAEHIFKHTLVRSHFETGWFANRTAVDIRIFQPKGPEVVLPWALCRPPQTLGVYFNYIDGFLVRTINNPVSFASLCYRLYMMFGMPGSDQPTFDLTQAFRTSLEIWFKSNTSSGEFTGTCAGLAPLLRSAPLVRHDVEMCSYWGSLPLRASKKIQEFKEWFPLLAKRTIEVQHETQCRSLLTISCEILRALKFILASVKNGPAPNDNTCVTPKFIGPDHRQLDPCKLLEFMLNATQQQANEDALTCYHKMLHDPGFATICRGHVQYDYTYFADGSYLPGLDFKWSVNVNFL